MSRFTRLSAIIVLVGMTATGASATELTITPGVGIGKVKLGMTRAGVTRVLGKDYLVNSRRSNSLELAWDFATWTVTFVGNRAVQVGVTLQSQKTPTGVGVGSSWRRLVHAYPHGVCTANSLPGPRAASFVEYLVPHQGGTQTIYFVPFPKRPPATWRVSEVRVRSPFERLPEFGPKWPSHCRKDWRTADAPWG